VEDLELSSVHFDLSGKDQRPAMICEDVDGLKIDDLEATVTRGIVPAWFYLVEHVTIRNSPQFMHVPTTRPSTMPSTIPSTMPATAPVD
jgi:hypothetical protein